MNTSYQQNQNQGNIYNADDMMVNKTEQTHSGSGDNVAGNKNITNDNRNVTVEKGNYIETIKGDYIENQNIYPPAPPPPLSSIPQKGLPSGTNTFVGRSKELQEIDTFFEHSSQLAVTSAVKSVTGMGGIGKTELAVQYALRYQKNYRGGICWVNARIDIAIQIISFCRSIDINPPDDFTLEEKIAFCWNHWIEGKVLLIFDDVQNYQAIKPYLPPKNDKFKLIVTSRQRLGALNQLELTVLSPENAIALLSQIIGENRVNQELAKANELCEWLGYLPLGLELVARYLITFDLLSLEDVLELLKEEKLEAEALLDPEMEGDMTARLGVASAFLLSWKELSSEAQELGCYLSLFKAESFDWAWVIDTNLFPHEDQKKQVRQLEKLRDKELRQFKLLQMDKEEGQSKPLFSCHPLVSLFFESKLEELEELATAQEFKQKFCQMMANLATSIDQTPTKQKIEEFTIIAPHLITVATEMIDYAEDDDLIWYFVSLEYFYEGQTVYEEAIKWLKQGLIILKKRLGEEHPSVATSINNLANLYESQGKYEQAEPLLLQGLEMCKKLLGEQHPNVATSINNLAYLYESQGKYEQAKSFYLQALDMRKKLLGEQHPHVAESINNLAYFYESQGKYEQAKSLYLQALEMCKKLLGEQHPHVATSINNLAVLYKSQGKYEQAKPLFLKALEMRKKLLGEQHPHVAQSINNLANLYQSQGKYEQAEPLFLKALEMRKKLLGEQHPDVAISVWSLVVLYESQRKYEEVESLYLQAIAIFYQKLGENHPRSLNINNHFRGFLQEMIKDNRVKELSEHPYTQSLLKQLALK